MDKLLWIKESHIELIDGLPIEVTTLYDCETEELIEDKHAIESTRGYKIGGREWIGELWD